MLKSSLVQEFQPKLQYCHFQTNCMKNINQNNKYAGLLMDLSKNLRLNKSINSYQQAREMWHQRQSK